MKKTITSHDLKNLVNEAHAQVKDLKGGKNANYIPFLDKIDSNLFGISVCLPSGEIIEAGDTMQIFQKPADKRTEDYITGRFG